MRMYFINSNKDVDPPYPQSWWDRMANDPAMSCPAGCGGVVPSLCPAPIDVPFERQTDETSIGCVLVRIFSTQLYDIVKPHLTGHVVGRCIHAENRSVISTHVTLYALPGHGIRVDGLVPHDTRYHVCKSCGWQYAQYSPKYVVRKNALGGRRAAMAGRHDALTVDTELMKQIRSMHFKNIHISSLPVVD